MGYKYPVNLSSTETVKQPAVGLAYEHSNSEPETKLMKLGVTAAVECASVIIKLVASTTGAV